MKCLKKTWTFILIPLFLNVFNRQIETEWIIWHVTAETTRENLWVDIYQEGKDAWSIVKEGCRLWHDGESLRLKSKTILTELTRRVVEAGEGGNVSNAVNRNIKVNGK